MKKVICGVLVAVMLAPGWCVHAEETKEKVKTVSLLKDEEKNTYTLSLEDAKNMALKNNGQIEAVEFKKKGFDISLDSAKITKAKYKNAAISVVGGSSGLLIKKGYYVEMYKVQSSLAILEKEKIKNQIAYDVTEEYYNYKLTEELEKLSENSVKIAKENLDAVNKQFELGLVTRLEVDGARAAYEGALSAVDSYKRGLKLAAESLRITLNIEEPCEFILTDGIEFIDFEADVEKDIEEAMKTRYDIKSLEENARLSEMNYTILKNSLTDAAAETSTAKSNFIQADYTLENSTKLIKLGIKSAYNNIVNAKNNCKLAQMTLDIKKQTYEADKIRYEIGMITNTSLTSSMNELRESEIELENAKLSYKLAVEKYNCEKSLGL